MEIIYLVKSKVMMILILPLLDIGKFDLITWNWASCFLLHYLAKFVVYLSPSLECVYPDFSFTHQICYPVFTIYTQISTAYIYDLAIFTLLTHNHPIYTICNFTPKPRSNTLIDFPLGSNVQ